MFTSAVCCRASPSRSTSLNPGSYDQPPSPRGSQSLLVSQKSNLSRKGSLLSSEGSGTLSRRRSIVFMQNSSRRGSLVEGQQAQPDGQQGCDSGEHLYQAFCALSEQ